MSGESPLEIRIIYDASGKNSGKRLVVAAPKVKHKTTRKAVDESSTVDVTGKADPETKPESRSRTAILNLDEHASDETVTTKKKSTRSVRTQSVAGKTSRGGAGLFLLSVMTMVLASGLLYSIIWRIDRHLIGPVLILETPVPVNDDDMGQIAEIFGAKPPVDPGPPPALEEDVAAFDLDAETPPMFTGAAARNIIIASAYGWEGISTLSCFLLLLAAGAGIGKSGGRLMRIAGVVISISALAWLIWAGLNEWNIYGTGVPPNHLRIGVAVVGLLFLALGLGLAGPVHGLHKLAAFGLLFAAICSVVALCLGNLCGAIDREYMSPRNLGLLFLAHSFWAWVLLFGGLRMTRRFSTASAS
jgi:hypothetical protein